MLSLPPVVVEKDVLLVSTLPSNALAFYTPIQPIPLSCAAHSSVNFMVELILECIRECRALYNKKKVYRAF